MAASDTFLDPDQDNAAALKVAEDVGAILTPNEAILGIAMQNAIALSFKKDSVVATSNRVILYRPSLLGRTQFEDYQWQDVRNCKIVQGMLSTEFSVELLDGRKSTMGDLDKDQAKRLYSVTQQLEQDWREKRRVREMEEARARAGGIQIGEIPGASSAARAEDPVQKLAKAKSMLDQGLISETEYESLKAKILASM
jgi:hypothetical protein